MSIPYQDVVVPVLAAALGERADEVRIEIAEDGTVFFFADGDESGFGFTVFAGESALDAALRLVDLLDSELPTTGIGWGRRAFLCDLAGHDHSLVGREIDSATVGLFCPERSDDLRRRIDLGSPTH